MVAHDVADTAYLIDRAAELSKEQWTEQISPGQMVLDWDGPEPSVGAVLGAIVWTKEVWLATIEGRDFPPRDATTPESTTPQSWPRTTTGSRERWTTMVSEYAAEGRLGDTVIDACAIRRSPSSCTASSRTCSPTRRTGASWPARCWPATASAPGAVTRWTG